MNQPIDRLTVAIETGTLTPLQRLRLASLLDVIDTHAANDDKATTTGLQAAYWQDAARWYRRLVDAEHEQIGGQQ